MDSFNARIQRPEEVLDDLARGDDNLGERLLRLASTAAALDRASILDLLADDAPVESESVSTPLLELNALQGESPSFAHPARLLNGEREDSSPRGCTVQVSPAIRRTEAAR